MADQQEPVAWAIQWNGGTAPDCEFCWRTKGICEDVLSQAGSQGKCVPIYMEPRTVLTDEEREAVYRAEARMRTAYVPDDETAATLRSLLSRLS